MKTLVVRIPDAIAAEIESTARARGLSKSEIARERLARPTPSPSGDADPLAAIRDLIGSVDDDKPADLSARKKHYLREWGYGRNRSR